MIITCPRCGGTGKTPVDVPVEGQEPEDCKFCDGAGRLKIEDNRITCPHCKQEIRLIVTYE